MIGSIRGNLLEHHDDYVLVEANGIGYKVFIPTDTAAGLFGKEDEEVFLYTFLSVREDALDLYGFSTTAEVDFFQNLLSISGIGPKSALAIISIAPLATLEGAIAAGDTSYLTNVSGIGKKIAQKIILELQDKISKRIDDSGEVSNQASAYQQNSEVMAALEALGYSKVQARSAVREIEVEPDTSTEDQLRAALKFLQK